MPLSGPIDLHTHSSVSDGTETPAELVRAGVAAGLGAMALTDHDTTAGWAVGIAEAHRLPITLIPGLELSTRLGWASVHLLGYLIDPTNEALMAETSKIRDGRRDRARSMVERIGRDYALDWDDVLAQTTPGATVGRPHIADALVARGHVSDRSAAFATILHWESGYYEPHYAPEPLEGVRLVRAAGGVPVLAHPGTNGRDRVMPEARLAELVDAGLFGLEVNHRDNTESGKARLLELAAKYKLHITGSSDYHGTGKPNHLGENTTSPDVADEIIAEATGFAPIEP